MKRKMILLLALVFALTMIPLPGFAVTIDKALESAIKEAKTKFSIPEDYKFSSNITTENNARVFSLSWTSTGTKDPISIYIRIDEGGTILGYSRYSSADYQQTRKLPKFSRQEAKAKADGYIKTIDAKLLSQIKYEDNTQSSIQDTAYYFTYYRVINGIPFYNDRVTVNINRETGALQDYSRQWTEGATFPAAGKVISADSAKADYLKNLGFRLIYRFSSTDNVLKAFPVYVPVYDNNNYGVDALTGERARLANNYYFGGEGDSMAVERAVNAKAAPEVSLSPDELKAVQSAASLITQEQAEKIAREAGFLNIAAASKVQYSNLSTAWPEQDKYIWSLQFNKPADDKSAVEEYTSVTIDAKSGVITSFYRGAPNPIGTKPKGNLAAAKKEAEALLQKYYSQYFGQMAYDKVASESNMTSADGSKDTSFTLSYSRLVNGIPFTDNGVYVNYDNLNGYITGFSLNWFSLNFPSAAKAVSLKAAGEKLFADVGLELGYKFSLTTPEELSAISKGYPIQNGKPQLVYTFRSTKPLYVDALSGKIINADGSEYKEAVKVNYTDIKGNAAEKQILVLAENGVYLGGTLFKPDTVITQKDFLTLLSKTLSYYGVITPFSTAKQTDDLYTYLQSQGIVKAGEKSPDSAVTREEAVKFLIRALKYDKVADIKGIYTISYKDKSSISKDLAGYVAIAAGLGIVDAKSSSFMPKTKLTRGNAAILIYNYLQV